jgi:hypothetical protein
VNSLVRSATLDILITLGKLKSLIEPYQWNMESGIEQCKLVVDIAVLILPAVRAGSQSYVSS